MGMDVTPEEVMEVMAREAPVDLRLATRMPNGAYKRFHDTEATWTDMHERGLVDKELYSKLLNGRHSFKQTLPAAAASDFVRMVGEAKNPTPYLAMVSQAAGAKKIGNDLVAIRREDIPGMDSRELSEIINEPLVREELSFEGGMQLLEVMAAKKVAEGDMDNEELKLLLRTAKAFQSQVRRLMGDA